MNEGGESDQMILLSQGPGKNVWMAGHNGLSKVIEDTTKVVEPVVKGNDLAAVVEIKSTPVCTGMSTGHLLVKAAGGVPPYSYAWSNNFGTNKSHRPSRRTLPGDSNRSDPVSQYWPVAHHSCLPPNDCHDPWSMQNLLTSWPQTEKLVAKLPAE